MGAGRLVALGVGGEGMGLLDALTQQRAESDVLTDTDERLLESAGQRFVVGLQDVDLRERVESLGVVAVFGDPQEPTQAQLGIGFVLSGGGVGEGRCSLAQTEFDEYRELLLDQLGAAGVVDRAGCERSIEEGARALALADGVQQVGAAADQGDAIERRLVAEEIGE